MSQSTVIPLVVVRHGSTPRSKFSNSHNHAAFLKVTDEGKRFLRSITAKKVSVIANVGPIASGKSLFSRCLLKNPSQSTSTTASTVLSKLGSTPRSALSLYRQGTGFAHTNVSSFPVKPSSGLSSSVLVSSGSLSTSHTSGIYVNTQPVSLSPGHVLLIFDVPGYLPPVASRMQHTWDDRHKKQCPGSSEDPYMALRFVSLALILASTLIVHGRLSRWSMLPHHCDEVVSHDVTELAAWLSPLVHATMRLRWKRDNPLSVPKLSCEDLHDLLQARRERAESERHDFSGPASTGNLRPRSPRQSTSGQIKTAVSNIFDELKLGLPQLLLLLRDAPYGIANIAAVEELLGISQGGLVTQPLALKQDDPRSGRFASRARKSQDSLRHICSGTDFGGSVYAGGSVNGGVVNESGSGAVTPGRDNDSTFCDEGTTSLFWPQLPGLRFAIQNMFPSIAVRGLPPPVVLSQNDEDVGCVKLDDIKESSSSILSKSATLRRNSSRNSRSASKERSSHNSSKVLDIFSSTVQQPRRRSVLDVESHTIAGNPNAIADVDAASIFDGSGDNQINPAFITEIDKLKRLLFSSGDEPMADPLKSLGFGSKDSLNAHRIRKIMSSKHNCTALRATFINNTSVDSNATSKSCAVGPGPLQQQQPQQQQQKFTTFSSGYKSFNPQYFAYLLDELVDDINIQITAEDESFTSFQNTKTTKFSGNSNHQCKDDDDEDPDSQTDSPTTNVSTAASTTTSTESRKLVNFPAENPINGRDNDYFSHNDSLPLAASATGHTNNRQGSIRSNSHSPTTDEVSRSSRASVPSIGGSRHRLSSQPQNLVSTAASPLRGSVKSLRHAFQSLPRTPTSVKLPGLTKPPKVRNESEATTVGAESSRAIRGGCFAGSAPKSAVNTSQWRPERTAETLPSSVVDGLSVLVRKESSKGYLSADSNWFASFGDALDFEPWTSVFVIHSAECFPICSVHSCVENAIERCLQPIRKLAEKTYVTSVMDMLKGIGQQSPQEAAEPRDASIAERLKRRFPCDEATVDTTHEIARDSAMQSYQLKVFSIFPEGSSSFLISHSAFANSESELAADIRKIAHRFRSANALRSDHHNKQTVLVEFERFVGDVSNTFEVKYQGVCDDKSTDMTAQRLLAVKECFASFGKHNFLENWYATKSRGPTSEKVLAESCLILFNSVMNWTLEGGTRLVISLPGVPPSPRVDTSVEAAANRIECGPIDLRYWNPKLWRDDQNNELSRLRCSESIPVEKNRASNKEDIQRRLENVKPVGSSTSYEDFVVGCVQPTVDSVNLQDTKTAECSMQSEEKSFTVVEIPNNQEEPKDSSNLCLDLSSSLSTDGSIEKDPELPLEGVRLKDNDVQHELESLQSFVKQAVAERESYRRRLTEALKVVDEYKALTKEQEERSCNMESLEYEVTKEKQTLELQLAELKADYYTKSEELQDVFDNCRSAGTILTRKKNGQKVMSKFLSNFDENHRLYLSKLFGHFSIPHDF